jgi:hypothetical protein
MAQVQSKQFGYRHTCQAIRRAVKQVLGENHIRPSTKRGNKELNIAIHRLALQPYSTLDDAAQVGQALGQQIVDLSKEKGKTDLDGGIIRQIVLLGDIPTAPKQMAKPAKTPQVVVSPPKTQTMVAATNQPKVDTSAVKEVATVADRPSPSQSTKDLARDTEIVTAPTATTPVESAMATDADELEKETVDAEVDTQPAAATVVTDTGTAATEPDAAEPDVEVETESDADIDAEAEMDEAVDTQSTAATVAADVDPDEATNLDKTEPAEDVVEVDAESELDETEPAEDVVEVDAESEVDANADTEVELEAAAATDAPTDKRPDVVGTQAK